MPSKVTPLPKTASGAANLGKTGAGGVPPKPGPKPAAKTGVTTKNKPMLFDTSRFANRITAATKDFRDMAKDRGGQGALSAILFVGIVGLGLIGLGIFLVSYGDEKYIVDLIVLGGLFLVMGVGSFVLGVIFVIWPIYKERRRLQDEERLQRAALASSNNQDNNLNPVFLFDEDNVDGPAPGTGSSAPVEGVLYDRDSLNAVSDTRGKLSAPPPPPIAQPLKDRPGTTSSTVSSVDTSDVSDGVSAGSQKS
ncbi:uncharacterized protein [Littorina saxatilis]|uniref:uncharacterized protein isoform X1 n=1 Tax=Littorina saxatilis TaxID=31220 RepID=UPI0038B55F65